MNIMLTCAGRRNYLVKFFQEILGNRGLVFAGDASAEAASLQEADQGFVLPPINHIDYFETLLDICQEHQVGLLIPLNDLELPLLARQRDRFLQVGTLAVVSAPEIIDICFDKWATFEFLKSCGIPVPQTYLSLAEARQGLERGEITFPVVVKPRWGSASIGIAYPEDDEELQLVYSFVNKLLSRTFLADISASAPQQCVLIQQRVFGEEYGIDVINDLESRYITTFVKRKLAMRAGETDRAITVRDETLENLGAKIGHKLGHIANLDCDVIVNSQGFYVIEMNPRFGGGYPFSHMAGANLPAALIAWFNGETADMGWLKVEANVMSSKCDRLVTKLVHI
ncbi:ATP-grasp domain-containing protein [Cylindrospermum sp. FACHB-282]|uniref:ATP-grasp domain-containing protein n=1 Tax=Cylindrospermum sp. FACHB-282 TaxID=2692794 RepID=UPI0016839365|nr:ATP-grasp domain-containing protein [Cylindrospermum sp. FACHB-282]MBD2387488.1 ATP-grasp domain-containing protein [Cylindrospermum sp. FACHB-282]